MPRNTSTFVALALTVGSGKFVAPAIINVPAKRANMKQSKSSCGLATLMMLACVGGVIMVSHNVALGQASFQGLGVLPGGAFQSEARGVSADGSVGAGHSESATATEAFRWTSSGIPVCGDGKCAEDECNCPADCLGVCPCIIFTNQAEFEAFNEQNCRTLKGVEDFEEGILPPASGDGLHDPLCGGIPNSPDAFPYPNGLDQLNMCVQSNFLGGAPVVPSPLGSNALVAVSAGFGTTGAVSDVVVPGSAGSLSWDLMLISPPVLPGEEHDHTGVGFNPLVLLGGNSVDILVYNKANALLASASSPADPAGSNFWGIWCADPIGRINVFDPVFGFEGADNIQLWEELECESPNVDCNLNGICDECDIEIGTSPDCNQTSVPDECEIEEGSSDDCNINDVPDECDIGRGVSEDCDINSVPDECESPDCPASLDRISINGGGTLSTAGPYTLIASSGQPGGVGAISSESYELADGFWYAAAAPGPCNSACVWDIDTSGDVRVPDLIKLLSCWGPLTGDPLCACLDIDLSGDVRVPDLIALLAKWGVCP